MAARRNTVQRKLILDELRRSRSHATAVELYKAVRHSLPRLSLGTVYRNLDNLCREGLVRKLGNPDRETRFDAVMEKHHHLRCMKCGRVEDFDCPVKVSIDDRDISLQGWQIPEPVLEFPGLCPGCRTASPQKAIDSEKVRSINA